MPPIAREAVKHGAEFLLIETMLDNDDRTELRCDARQAITITRLKRLIPELQEIYSKRADYNEN